MPSSNSDHASNSDHVTPADAALAAPAQPQNEYALTRGQGGPVLIVRGEIDLYGKAAFEAALAQAADQWQAGQALTVDLTDVWFIDSSALSALLCQWRQLPRGTRFILRVLQNSLVSRVLRLSEWGSIFDIQTATTD